ncbi:hypothetical protein F503_05883 [Ophiostoma piceae UAMH 11346]|uniref:Uncharacterized protein n=1 Tax=Ophiostoma piceae (strain UAMH 11346) TaxID=1262450 RepID=S3CVR4_OPHP1|nr:hypothetical protein F503_05883 [Ophiostoma piceae UAMH 11346]
MLDGDTVRQRLNFLLAGRRSTFDTQLRIDVLADTQKALERSLSPSQTRFAKALKRLSDKSDDDLTLKDVMSFFSAAAYGVDVQTISRAEAALRPVFTKEMPRKTAIKKLYSDATLKLPAANSQAQQQPDVQPKPDVRAVPVVQQQPDVQVVQQPEVTVAQTIKPPLSAGSQAQHAQQSASSQAQQQAGIVVQQPNQLGIALAQVVHRRHIAVGNTDPDDLSQLAKARAQAVQDIAALSTYVDVLDARLRKMESHQALLQHIATADDCDLDAAVFTRQRHGAMAKAIRPQSLLCRLAREATKSQ